MGLPIYLLISISSIMVNKTFININFMAIHSIPKPKPKSAKNNAALKVETIKFR